MRKILENKLDNPVWFSLLENHHQFSILNNDIGFYHPDYCPFGGFVSDDDNISDDLLDYSNRVDSFFIVGNKPKISNHLEIKNELVCNQMLINNKIDIEINDEIIWLQDKHHKELFDLVTLVQPGYFKEKTPLLGNYFGIFNNGKLVAATGERMKMKDYFEVSAVVTHPDHTGQGYAKQLISVTVNNIFSQNKVPFLHVAETNLAAISLYQKLGFYIRRKISFWHLVKKTPDK